MPKGNWRRYGAIGLIVGLCLLAPPTLGQSDPDGDAVGYSTDSNPDPDKAKAAFDADFWSQNPGQYKTYEAICKYPQDREYADLCQQWRAANAAKESSDWALPQFVIGVFSVVGLILSLIFTGWAAVAASRAARAADKAVEITERSAMIELRAYLTVDNIEHRQEYGPSPGLSTYNGQPIPGPIIAYLFVVRVRNGGTTPARRTVTNVNSRWFPNGIPEDFDFPDAAESELGMLGPNAATQFPITVPIAQITGAVNSPQRFGIWGWVEYDDVFDNSKRHRTEFCTEGVVTHISGSATANVLCHYHRRYNNIDSDCERQPAPYPGTA